MYRLLMTIAIVVLVVVGATYKSKFHETNEAAQTTAGTQNTPPAADDSFNVSVK